MTWPKSLIQEIGTVWIQQPGLNNYCISYIWSFSSIQGCADSLEMVYVEILFKLRILKLSFRNHVSSLLSTDYSAFLFTGPFYLAKAQSFKSSLKIDLGTKISAVFICRIWRKFKKSTDLLTSLLILIAWPNQKIWTVF